MLRLRGAKRHSAQHTRDYSTSDKCYIGVVTKNNTAIKNNNALNAFDTQRNTASGRDLFQR